MRYLLLLPFMFIFLACQDKTRIKGASEMHWDRDMCSRCVMVISDRKNSIQVQDPTSNKVYKFDDIGCMVLWTEESKIKWIDRADIWITDVQTGEWIDARSAFYTSGNVTPMAFGYSAYKSKENIDKNKDISNFSEVYKQIKK